MSTPSEIRQAIERFRDIRLNVYRDDPDQIVRDANSASETTRDHVGRWMYELIQNSDDAHGTSLLVRVTPEAVYIADDGDGLSPDTIKSLSGTHLSVKPLNAIGRKGLGFKSVYAISRTPQVFSKDDGVLFSAERSSLWLREHGVASTRVPYQWLPFWISRRDAEVDDPLLASLKQMTTVVKLPLADSEGAADAIKSVRALPGYTLLTFRFLRQLELSASEKRKSFCIRKEEVPNRDNEWRVLDTRQPRPALWRLSTRAVSPPAETFADFEDEDDRQRAAEVNVALAALLDAAGAVNRPPEPLNLHVYYPTEDPAPIQGLLHADFVVKSDRTRVVPFQASRFNTWIATQLAEHVVECVDRWYLKASPGSNLRILVQPSGLSSFPLSSELSELVTTRARRVLRLPNTSGDRVLKLPKALRIGTSVGPTLARQIFERTAYASRLVHSSLDSDKDVRAVLDKLGCKGLTDEDLLSAVDSASHELVSDEGWLWACWRWASEWNAHQKTLYGEPKGVSRLQRVAIIPISGRAVSVASLGTKALSWRDSANLNRLPPWLPLELIDDWLRTRLASLSKEDPIRVLAAALGIEEPTPALLLQALTRAVVQFWDVQKVEPREFLSYLKEMRFHEHLDASQELQGCPIAAKIEGKAAPEVVRARSAYFGRRWGNDLLAELFEGVAGVCWADRPSEENDDYRNLLTWLGVCEHPRLVSNNDGAVLAAERERVRARLQNYSYTGLGNIPAPKTLDQIEYQVLDRRRTTILLRLLVRHWRYYSAHIRLSVDYRYYTWQTAQVPAGWWEELLTHLKPPLNRTEASAPLQKCWLPDPQTTRAIGPLLPIIDVEAFGPDSSVVAKWLVDAVGVRTQLAEVPVAEWREILTTRIPALVPRAIANYEGGHQKVLRWYESCLDSLDEQEQKLPLSNCPLLCKRGDSWEYVAAAEPRWLADDTDVAHAFRNDTWQITFPRRLHADAINLFRLSPLSTAKVEPRWGATSGEEDPTLQQSLEGIKPYVFSLRCYETQQDHERLRDFLKDMRVRTVNSLEAVVTLGTLSKVVEKPVAVVENVLLLNRSQAGVTLLGQALARALEVQSDADVYENLLRCENDTARLRKLEARNCPTEQVQALLHEYHTSSDRSRSKSALADDGTANVSQVPSIHKIATPRKPEIGDAPPGTGIDASSESDESGSHTTPEATKSLQPTPVPIAPAQGQVKVSTTSATTRASPPDTRVLKELDQPARVVRREPASISGPSRRDRPRPINDPDDSAELDRSRTEALSYEERMLLEGRGREFASRILRDDMGYEVTSMPDMNPGYDLLAKKGDDILRVEVKAHLHAASVIDLTIREHEEYVRWKTAASRERWELWNIEHLAADTELPVIVMRFSEIPDGAIDAKLFRVDLRRCS